MKTLNLNRLSVSKIAVLATGLTAAVLVGTMAPQAALATPSRGTTCIGCHTAGGSVIATPSTATPASGAAYTVAMAVTSTATGNFAYAILDAAGAQVVIGGPAATMPVAAMTAPTAAGTYVYTVHATHGYPGQSSITTFSITVGATTTPPPVTTTTAPPVTTTTAPPVTTTTAPPVTTTTAPPVTTTTAPPVTTTTAPPVTTTTAPPVTTTTAPPVTTTTAPPVTTTNTPGSPTNVKATAGNAQATVSWDAPKDDGGMPIVGYIVLANDGGVLAPTEGTETTMTMTGLTNGTSYTFTVVAFNEGENFGSDASASSNAVTPVGPAASATATTPVVAGSSAVIPVGAPDTGAGGTSGSNNGPMAGLGGLALLMAGAGATQVVRRRRQV